MARKLTGWSEQLTSSTRRFAKKMTILLYGSAYWKKIVNFEALVRHGMISPEDLKLFRCADGVETAFEILKEGLMPYVLQPETPETPAIAKSRNPQSPRGREGLGAGRPSREAPIFGTGACAQCRGGQGSWGEGKGSPLDWASRHRGSGGSLDRRRLLPLGKDGDSGGPDLLIELGGRDQRWFVGNRKLAIVFLQPVAP